MKKERISDPRYEWILHDGDKLRCEDGKEYTIIGDPVGYGGSSILYAAERNESSIHFTIKECFPADISRYIRLEGTVSPREADDIDAVAYLQHMRKLLCGESEIGQKIANTSGRAIGAWDLLNVQQVEWNGVQYNSSNGVFAVFERLDEKGCFLSAILDECQEKENEFYPLRTGGLPHIHTTTCIMRELLKALDNVHKAGYIHGDIQDGNLFFNDARLERADIGFGCLVDFGCARELSEGNLTPEITDRMIYSTNGFVPPEILTKNDGHLRLGKTADIYSAGRLFLYLLTGKTYFERGSDKLLRNPDLKKLTLTDGRKIGCTVENLRAVNDILAKALQFEAEKRYQDAAEMLAVIEALQAETKTPEYVLSSNLSTADYFVPGSRDEEIAFYRKALETENPVWIWGFGGLGKTELAIAVAREEQRRTNHKAYLIHYHGSMKQTIADLDFSGYHFQAKARGMTADEVLEQTYREKFDILKTSYKDAVLIFDNFDSENKRFNEMRAEPAFTDVIGLSSKLIFTTRYDVKKPEYEIKPLKEPFLLQLAREFAPADFPDETLLSLIRASENHTLMVEIIAKTLRESYGTIGAEEILTALEKSKLSTEDYPGVDTSKDRKYLEDSIYGHLRALFNVTGLSDNEKFVLRHASLFPASGFMYDYYETCVGNVCVQQVKSLLGRGWLSVRGDNLWIHPLVRDISVEELNPSDDTCGAFLTVAAANYNENEEYDSRMIRLLGELFWNASETLEDQVLMWTIHAVELYDTLGDISRTKYLSDRLLDRIKNIPESDKIVPLVYSIAGGAESSIGKYNKSLELYHKAEHLELKYRGETEELAVYYRELSVVYGLCGDSVKQINFALRAHEINEKYYSNDSVEIAISNFCTGSIYNDTIGDPAAALRVFLLPAYSVFVNKYPHNHPLIANSSYKIGQAYYALLQFDESLKYLYQSFRIWRDNDQLNHPNLGGTCIMIASIYLMEDKLDLEKAYAFILLAEDNIDKTLPDDHPDRADLLRIKARIEYFWGEFDLSIEYCEKAIELLRVKILEDNEAFAYNYHQIAECYVRKGLNHEALKWYEKAIDVLGHMNEAERLIKSRDSYVSTLTDKWQSITRFPRHDFIAQLYLQTAASYIDINNIDKAIPLLEKSSILKNTTAMMLLATLYDDGKLLKRNPRKALEYYRMLDASGDTTEDIRTKISKLSDEIKPKGIMKFFRK